MDTYIIEIFISMSILESLLRPLFIGPSWFQEQINVKKVFLPQKKKKSFKNMVGKKWFF